MNLDKDPQKAMQLHWCNKVQDFIWVQIKWQKDTDRYCFIWPWHLFLNSRDSFQSPTHLEFLRQHKKCLKLS